MEGMQIEGIAVARARPAVLVRARGLVRGPWLLLVAVGLVVVLVSLPLLRGLALKENELDAIQTMNLLGREVFAAEAEPRTLGELVQTDERLLRRLPDTCLMEDGRLLFRHGYLFELVRPPEGAPGLYAWPFAYGETGLGAFHATSAGELLGHPNQEARWSGPTRNPAGLPGEASSGSVAWREVSSLLSRESGF